MPHKNIMSSVECSISICVVLAILHQYIHGVLCVAFTHIYLFNFFLNNINDAFN